MKRTRKITFAILAVAAGASTLVGWHPSQQARAAGTLVAPGLVLPRMDPANGKRLFASKGCVVCHSINGVGGTDAPALDASTMEPAMNPFDFFAKMWRGAEPMIAMQNNELGHQIVFTGEDLADIVAFVHNRAIQTTFTANDIPDDIKALMQKDAGSGGGSMTNGSGAMGGGMMGGSSMGK